ncbi:MAG: PilZ domain-containing protein [Pseudomonadota bacterium]
MNAGADQALFGDALGCEERLPVEFLPGAVAPPGAAARDLMLLRVLATMEDGAEGERDEGDARSAEMARVEARLDLVLALLGALAAARADTLPCASLRWSRLGARLILPAAPVAPGGVLRVPLDPRLPQPRELPARLLAAEPQGADWMAWLRFEALDAALETAVERHVFRRHRRAIAEVRRAARA